MRGRKESKICDFGWLLNEPQYGVLPHLLGFLGLVEVTTSSCLVCKSFRAACDTSLAGRRVSDEKYVKEILERRPCPELLLRLVRCDYFGEPVQNFLFRWASENGHDGVVAQLLEHPKVDPSA